MSKRRYRRKVDTYYARGLDLRFAANGVLPAAPTISASGGANGKRWDSSGTLVAATAPRFDHDPATGAPLGLLIEAARTNFALRSESFNEADWTKNRTTANAIDVNDPAGGSNGSKILETTAPGAHQVFQSDIAIIVSSTQTHSIFVQKLGRRYIKFNIAYDSATANFFQTGFFDFDTGAFTGAGSAGGNGTYAAQSVKDIGSGWYRISVTGVASSIHGDADARMTIQIHDDAQAASYTGVITKGVYVYGAMAEVAAFPTSYIATTTASVERTADVVTMNVSDFVFDANNGTFLLEGSFPFASSAARAILTVDDGGTTDRFYFELDASENVNFSTTHSADTDGASDGSGVIAVDTTFKVSGAYADDDVRAAVDGTLSPADTTAALPLADTMTTVRFGADSAGNYFNGHIARIVYYPIRLPNGILQALTR